MHETCKRFLSHNDQDVASYSTQCVFQHNNHNDKIISSSSHINTIASLVSTTSCLELHDALINCNIDDEDNDKERKEVVSILLHVLFGRMSSNHSTKRRKMEESPARVRHAILFFLSKHLSSKDLDLWAHHMMQIFIHSPGILKHDMQEQLQNAVVVNSNSNKDVINAKNVPLPRIKGFLILLGDVASNFGCHLTHFHVECFFKILLILLEFAAVQTQRDQNSASDENDETGVKEEEEDDDIDKIKLESDDNKPLSLTAPLSSSVSSIHSLICDRSLDLFLQCSAASTSTAQEETFASIFLSYKSFFWKITQLALRQLPTTFINCDVTATKPPILLSLIRAISSK